jgi:L,D-transpeptidase-like protein
LSKRFAKKPSMLNVQLTRRNLLATAGVGMAAAGLARSGLAYAEPQSDNAPWITNTQPTKLIGADDLPIVSMPAQTPLRVTRSVGNNMIEVWAPRYGLYGRLPPDVITPIPAPALQDLAGETAAGPLLIAGVGLPGRVSGGANLRSWPVLSGDTVLRVTPHNAPLHVLDRVQGDAGDEWYSVNLLDPTFDHPIATGFIHSSLVRIPRMRDQTVNPDRDDSRGRHFQADLQEPAMLAAFENGSPVWATLALKGTDASATPLGAHKIFARVANETMTSERVVPPIPRNAPGGYYLEGVLYTQYFTDDGASIHYNYWSSNWGYPGTHGCLGIDLDEAKFAWNFASIGTLVYIFA